MHHGKLLSILRSIFNCPTAPFHEYHVRDHLLELLADFPHVSVEQDGFGNLIALYRRGSGKARWAFGAHMDHPGWVKNPAGKDLPKGGLDARFPEMQFLGGVPASYLPTGEVKNFGEFAMWDLPAFEYDREEDRISGRVCDDLVGCAAIIALFYELEQRQVMGSCYGIFTRAEEVGFVGAVDLAKSGKFPQGACFVSLETSSPRGGVEMGKGPVVRVGDRMSVFDDEATAQLLAAAEASRLEVQRALLDGGACEATAMKLYGIRSAGISVLLGNYHNCDPSGKIDSEYVRLKDVKVMIDLIANLVQFAEVQQENEDGGESDRLKLEKRWKDYAPYVQATAGKFGDEGEK
ncbi:MAG: M20/M25/M40 family metallo-hydrolase [Verrucomicrobiales bacterium]|nr:M20/M25/M40 family metallo-hydrolase [Verrucomicrobiales bacterium]